MQKCAICVRSVEIVNTIQHNTITAMCTCQITMYPNAEIIHGKTRISFKLAVPEQFAMFYR